MDLRIAGHVAVVSGAGRGIGVATGEMYPLWRVTTVRVPATRRRSG
jgi:hypothetical protein